MPGQLLERPCPCAVATQSRALHLHPGAVAAECAHEPPQGMLGIRPPPAVDQA